MRELGGLHLGLGLRRLSSLHIVQRVLGSGLNKLLLRALRNLGLGSLHIVLGLGSRLRILLRELGGLLLGLGSRRLSSLDVVLRVLGSRMKIPGIMKELNEDQAIMSLYATNTHQHIQYGPSSTGTIIQAGTLQ